MTLVVNGHAVAGDLAPGTTLLSVIRDRLGLHGTKLSCGRGECGACTVLVDGRPVMSCIAFAELVDGEVTTIEALAGQERDLREAFAEFGGFQCGFCTSGQIVHASAILAELAERHPRENLASFVRHRLSGNICRCTGYNGIVEAVVQTHLRRQAAAPLPG